MIVTASVYSNHKRRTSYHRFQTKCQVHVFRTTLFLAKICEEMLSFTEQTFGKEKHILYLNITTFIVCCGLRQYKKFIPQLME